MITIDDCRLHVLPLMQAINKFAAEFPKAPIDILRNLSVCQDNLRDVVAKAVEEDTDRAWRIEQKGGEQ